MKPHEEIIYENELQSFQDTDYSDIEFLPINYMKMSLVCRSRWRARYRKAKPCKPLRDEVHKLFDPLWQNTQGPVDNNKVIWYGILSLYMGMNSAKCHMSKMNRDQLKRAKIIVLKIREDNDDKILR